MTRAQVQTPETWVFADEEPQMWEAGTGRSRPMALLSATRPRQWTKNLLVFAAPTAAGSIVHPGVVARSVVAALVFVAASAATYLVNDVSTGQMTGSIPSRRSRPIASGQLSVGLALATRGRPRDACARRRRP